MTIRPFLFLSAVCLADPATASETCLPYPFDDAPASLRAILELAAPALQRFPDYPAALAAARPVLCLDDEPFGARGYLDVDDNRIVISADLSEHEQMVILLHELRHLQQIGEGFCPASLTGIDGTGSRQWGEVILSFDRPGFPTGWTLVAGDCFACVGNAEADQRSLQLIAQVSEELEDHALFARTAGE